MEKRKEFTRDTIEVCRNCKSEGKVDVEMPGGYFKTKTTCPICGGSGLVRKHIEGFVSVEPHTKTEKA